MMKKIGWIIYGHTYGPIYGHTYGPIYGHVYGHMYGHIWTYIVIYKMYTLVSRLEPDTFFCNQWQITTAELRRGRVTASGADWRWLEVRRFFCPICLSNHISSNDLHVVLKYLNPILPNLFEVVI